MSRPYVIKERDWWKEGFSAHDLIADADLYFDTGMAEKEIWTIMGFLKDAFGFSPMAAIDLCCGTGRHVSALQQYVPYVVGLDYSSDFLKAGIERDFSDKLIRGDAYHLPLRSSSFDLVTCMGNSLGYANSRDDRLLASEASRVLRKGGYIVLNATDPAYCRETLQRTTAYEYETPRGKIVDLYQRRIEHNNLLKCKQTTLRDGEKVRILHYSIRLFEDDDMTTLGAHAGIGCVDRIRSRDMHGDAEEGTMGAMANSNFYIFRKTSERLSDDEKPEKHRLRASGQ
jgi:ubiquinone/menaquinone biosynthesis C-methylase UbiE